MAQIIDDRKNATIERRAKLFRGFADPSRLAILGALCNERLAVHEIFSRWSQRVLTRVTIIVGHEQSILTDTHGIMHRSALKAQLADRYNRRLALAAAWPVFTPPLTNARHPDAAACPWSCAGTLPPSCMFNRPET